MPKQRHPPAPFTSPNTGSLDQRLAQIVAMINSLSSTNVSPTFQYIALTDETGQTWAVYCQSNGQLRTELVTPP